MGENIPMRLRLAAQAHELSSAWTLTVAPCSLLVEAADEIERLQAKAADKEEDCRHD